jgi:hypothetical protein
MECLELMSRTQKSGQLRKYKGRLEEVGRSRTNENSAEISPPMTSSPTTSSLHLSPQELSLLMMNPTMRPSVSSTFAHDPTATAVLRYYCFISQTMDTLEQHLEQCHGERQAVFDFLFQCRDVPTLIRPLVHDFRRRTMGTRSHPYGRTPSPSCTPSDDNSVQPPSEAPEETFTRIPTSIGSALLFNKTTDEHQDQQENANGNQKKTRQSLKKTTTMIEKTRRRSRRNRLTNKKAKKLTTSR